MGDLTGSGLFNPASISGFYVGSVIAIAALCLPAWIRRKTDRALPPVVLCVLATLMALGSSTPVYTLAARLPLLGSFRFPARYLLLSSFCAAALGAIALHRVIALSRLRSRTIGLRPLALLPLIILPIAAVFCFLLPDRRGDVVFCLALLTLSAAFLGLLFRARKSGQRYVILSLICLFLPADLFYFRARWNYASTADIQRVLRKDGVPGWLAKDPDQFRILAVKTGFDERLDIKSTLLQSSPPIWGLQSLGYSFSLGLRDYGDFLNRLLLRLRTEPAAIGEYSKLLDFMRVKS